MVLGGVPSLVANGREDPWDTGSFLLTVHLVINMTGLVGKKYQHLDLKTCSQHVSIQACTVQTPPKSAKKCQFLAA